MKSSKSGVITSSELMRKLYIVRLTQCSKIPGSSQGEGLMADPGSVEYHSPGS